VKLPGLAVPALFRIVTSDSTSNALASASDNSKMVNNPVVLSNVVLASENAFGWQAAALILTASAGWDCFAGSVRFGRYLEFDKEDSPSQFMILVGLKFVAAFLIAITMCFGTG
jgi:hypothetical protein